MKNLNDHIGNRTREVPQPIAPLRTRDKEQVIETESADVSGK
jgi:hypothetical protein